MSKIDNITILQTVKEDNLALFSAYIEGKESLSFGRFPLLTLCYMYEANKIIAKYREVLSSIRKYSIVAEPFEVYKKFREVAGRALRLYRDDDAIVSPIEMLAILKKDSLVKKYFGKFYITEKAKRNIKAIYKQSQIKVTIDGNSIDIAHRPLEYKQRKVYGLGLVLSSSFAALITILCVLVGSIYGLGIKSSPFMIYTEKQLYRALNTSGHYVLAADIEISNFKDDLEFKGVLDGNGYVLTVNSIPDSAIVDINMGTIKNLNILYRDGIGASVDNEKSLLITHNEGVISSVNIICVDMSFTFNKSSDKVISLCGFATNNRGRIEGSNLFMTAGISSSGDGEGFASGFSINNSGVIRNCEFVKDSIIYADTIDVSGFTIENKDSSGVYDCVNNCAITQVSSLDGWSPTVAGITLTNYGEIVDCINRANLTNISRNTSDNANGIIFVGGISANNYRDIVKCYNSGDINIDSQKLMVYAGGIFAYADIDEKEDKSINPSIVNCGIKADINITTIDEKAYVFVGGIGGYLCGEISECFSMANIPLEYNDKKYFVGTALGAARCEIDPWFGSVSGIYIGARDNYVLNLEGTDYQIAALIYVSVTNSSTIIPTGLNGGTAEIQTLEYESQIMQKEVYWSE